VFKSHKLLAGIIAVFALAVVGAGGAWYLLRNDAPDAVSLESALQSIGASSNGASGRDEELVGAWNVVQGETSFVGYRVNETLGGVGATTAVGRTQSVQGSLHYDGDKVTKVEINADISTLQSDKSMRDNAIKTQALESNTYPTATFALASPIDIADVPGEGETVTKTVAGDLTLHGVTKKVQLDVQGVLQGGQVVLVGSADIKFADFGMAQPRAAAVLSVEDHGTMEFQLVFSKTA